MHYTTKVKAENYSLQVLKATSSHSCWKFQLLFQPFKLEIPAYFQSPSKLDQETFNASIFTLLEYQ